jgi:bifunctional non-homologous end joining protein LigD
MKTMGKDPWPEWIEPMTATLTSDRFSRPNWFYEPKMDGVRCLAYGKKGQINLFSRRKLSMNSTYPEITDVLKQQSLSSYVLDGEIVAFRPGTTTTSFEVLQQRLGLRDIQEARRSPVRVYFYIFDLLYAKGHDLRAKPLADRKNYLRELVRFGPLIRFTTHREGEGEKYYEEACRNGWEGLIAKRRDSPYQSARSKDWLKFKCIQEQEFVIGGFTEPDGGRHYFGALLLGYYEGNVLRFAGKVGTGFSERTLEVLWHALQRLQQEACPFARVEPRSRRMHWVKPILVAQIGFAEWTKDGKLRQGRFVGLRADKKPEQVRREIPISIGGSHGKKESGS